MVVYAGFTLPYNFFSWFHLCWIINRNTSVLYLEEYLGKAEQVVGKEIWPTRHRGS